MGVVRINELPEASGLTSDDLLVVMDDPSGTAITKKIPINIFKTNEIDWTLIINSDNSLSAYNTTTIGVEAFKSTSIIGLRIGNNVTTISEGAFNDCAGLVGGLIIPNSVTSIGNDAFRDGVGFAGSLVLSNSLTTLGVAAFKNCSGFTGSLIIPNSLTAIEDDVFGDCSGFSSLILPNSLTSIGDNAFVNCSSFTGSLVLPNSLTVIGFQGLQNCGFTGDLVIPNSVATLGEAAFAYSDGYVSLTIGSGISSMGGGVFYDCSGITNVNCYIERTVFPDTNEFGNCVFTTLHARASDSTWDEGTTTLGDHTFDVIKDL